MPDNLKSGVSKASFFDPVLNPSYYELARHYGTGDPADPGAQAEGQGGGGERGPAGRALDPGALCATGAFFTLAELNAAIVPLREALNNRPLAPPRDRHPPLGVRSRRAGAACGRCRPSPTPSGNGSSGAPSAPTTT